MHHQLVAELLDREIEIVQADPRLGPAVRSIARDGPVVRVEPETPPTPCVFELHGDNYNADPLSLRVVSIDGTELLAEQWPGGLSAGEHPSLHRPFACLQGLYEYHCHQSHLEDPWDRYRNERTLAVLLSHILTKAQCA